MSLDLFGTDTVKTVPMQGAEGLGRVFKIAGRLIMGATLGGTVGAIGGAVLYTSHRIVGGLLGGFLVGPIAGVGLAYAISYSDLKRLKELKAQQRTVKMPDGTVKELTTPPSSALPKPSEVMW